MQTFWYFEKSLPWSINEISQHWLIIFISFSEEEMESDDDEYDDSEDDNNTGWVRNLFSNNLIHSVNMYLSLNCLND